MSLTNALKDKSSPLSRLMTNELPDVASLRAAYRARLPTGVEPLVPNPPSGGRPQWGTLGAAIDHRLRFALTDVVPRDGAIAVGVERTGWTLGPVGVPRALRSVGLALLDELEGLVGEHRPFDRRRPMLLPSPAEERLARACHAAAWYEEVTRTGQVWPGTPLGDAGADFKLDSLLAAVPTYAVQDMAAVVSLAESGLGVVRARTSPCDVIAGPTFMGSIDVGGADADLIAGDLLVDVKSTVTPTKLAAQDVYELAGYVLLDYNDDFGVGRVGWYLSRIGSLVTWDVGDFFALLGAQQSVAELRARTKALPWARARHRESGPDCPRPPR